MLLLFIKFFSHETYKQNWTNRIEFRKPEQKLSEQNGIQNIPTKRNRNWPNRTDTDDDSVSILFFRRTEWNLSKSQLNIMIYTPDSCSKKIYSIFNMAARREDLPSRCLSLLEWVKDLFETHNSEQSGSENYKILLFH